MASIEERLKGAPTRLIILAACGFARTVEHLLTYHRSRIAITTAERYADGRATKEEVIAAVGSAEAASAARAAPEVVCAAEAAEAAARTAVAGLPARAAARAAWSAVETVWKATSIRVEEQAKAARTVNESILDCILGPRRPFPFPTHVKGLASQVYENWDWSLLPILADALEEIGLEQMAAHCRQPIHAKGCHVLDAILGK